uniref:Poly-gamma-glutamate synthase PgsB n=1 Tax=Pseudothermotoga hypogea TaxID=57487 RepID=A0A832I684_9THEM
MEISMVVSLLCLLAFITYLSVEAFYARSIREGLKLRIVVTGVRGKSSTTRLITFALRRTGMRVLGKVTGSKPVLLYPDGEEIAIHRRTKPSVLEQVRVLLRLAKRLRVTAVVCESMSVKPEILGCEIQNILKPHIIVITRLTVDHMDDLGTTIEEVRRNIVSACSTGSTVISMKGNLDEASLSILRRKNCTVLEVEPKQYVSKPTDYFEFEENITLALAVCKTVGIREKDLEEVFLNVRGDIGALRCWKLPNGVIAINGFAANDPDSTIRIFAKARQFLDSSGLFVKKLVGILNLRSDRVDRTIQWLKHLRSWFPFDLLYVTGSDSTLFAKRLGNPKCIPRDLERIINDLDDLESGTVVFGFGNIANAGLRLVNIWQERGTCLRQQS